MRANPAMARRVRGYSIIELMTVVAIVAIMLGIAVPSFQEFVVNYRTSVQTNDLLSDLAIARSEAVKYARRTEVRAETGDWTDGWIVWTDLDTDGSVDESEVVKRHGEAEPEFTIEAGDTSGIPANLIAFGVTGAVIAPAGTNPIEFAVCRPDNDADRSRGIRLERSGRAESRNAATNTSVNC